MGVNLILMWKGVPDIPTDPSGRNIGVSNFTDSL